MNKVHFRSRRSTWATPPELFQRLNDEYGPFDLDVCATTENKKCDAFLAAGSLEFPWHTIAKRAWMNPPYGRGIGKWVEKAATAGIIVCCLLPARTDTKWFQKWCLPVIKGERAGDYEFLPGRVKFVGAKNGAPFPSVVVVFRW